MTNVTDLDLLELNKWIDINLFDAGKYVGLKKRGLWWRPNSCGYTDNESEAGRYTHEEANKKAHGGEEPVTIHEFSTRKYASDDEAAFQVLGRCVDRLNATPLIIQVSGGFYSVTHPTLGSFSLSKSLSVSICLFAKQLFSK